MPLSCSFAIPKRFIWLWQPRTVVSRQCNIFPAWPNQRRTLSSTPHNSLIHVFGTLSTLLIPSTLLRLSTWTILIIIDPFFPLYILVPLPYERTDKSNVSCSTLAHWSGRPLALTRGLIPTATSSNSPPPHDIQEHLYLIYQNIPQIFELYTCLIHTHLTSSLLPT